MSNEIQQGWARRAFQAWPLLTFAARHHQILTYAEVGQHVGLQSVAVGDALGPIYRYCKWKGLPFLNLIVVNRESGKPENKEFSQYDIPREQARVFRHTWFNEGNHAEAVPSIEEFQEAMKAVAAFE